MYENEANYPMQEMAAKQITGVAGSSRRLDVTLRQNIDGQIAQAKAQVAVLEETKARMEASGILDMRIDDLNRAMRF